MTDRDGRSSLSAPDAPGGRTYRQHLRAGRRPIRIVRAVTFAWLAVGLVGFWVLILAAGRQGAPAVIGAILWIGPIVVLSIPSSVGPRGPFRGWWLPRLIVRLDDDGLAWWTEGSARRPGDAVAWSAVASLGPTLPGPGRPPGADCALRGPGGAIVARLPCRLVRLDRTATRPWRRVVWLPDVAVAVRPDRYRRRRVLARRATLREPEADAQACR